MNAIAQSVANKMSSQQHPPFGNRGRAIDDHESGKSEKESTTTKAAVSKTQQTIYTLNDSDSGNNADVDVPPSRNKTKQNKKKRYGKKKSLQRIAYAAKEEAYKKEMAFALRMREGFCHLARNSEVPAGPIFPGMDISSSVLSDRECLLTIGIILTSYLVATFLNQHGQRHEEMKDPQSASFLYSRSDRIGLDTWKRHRRL
ncbi:hypothetical protein F4778DRAFT_238310 [Xylariomycetidae sp. FL2044]|nr:hypothetical protein F4778DRAFT_238310 [Xylariomycetidae sp. FL2044]